MIIRKMYSDYNVHFADNYSHLIKDVFLYQKNLVLDAGNSLSINTKYKHFEKRSQQYQITILFFKF